MIDLKDLKTLWEDFANIPINDDDEIEAPFMHFEAGTSRFDVWHWFDEQCPNGLALDILEYNTKDDEKVLCKRPLRRGYPDAGCGGI